MAREESIAIDQRVIRWVLAAATILAPAVLYLLPYVVRQFHFPLGYDFAYYTRLANAATVERVDALGTIRVTTPLLLAVLMRTTGLSALTLVAWFPALVTGIAGLAAAAMLRTSLGVRPVWFPIVGFLSWAAFGANTMVRLHLDNLLNAALVLAALAAALAYVERGKGAVAAAAFFAVAGLTHWPFYLFAIGFFVPAVLGFAGRQLWRRITGREQTFGVGLPLLGAAAGSGLVVALPFFLVSSGRLIGVELGGNLLRVRFLHRLGDLFRFYAFPLAAAGGLVAARVPLEPPDGRPTASGASSPSDRLATRRFFVWLMASWVVVSIAAGIAQLLGVPVAGARLLSYLFPIPILTAVFVWWLARLAASRLQPHWVGVGTALVLVVGSVVGFGGLTWVLDSAQRPRLTNGIVQEVSAAGDYATWAAPGRPAVFLLIKARGWSLLKAPLSNALLNLARRTSQTPEEYLAGVAAGGGSTTGLHPPEVALILRKFNGVSFARLATAHPERVVAPGVFVLRGPVPTAPVRLSTPPSVSTSPIRLALVSLEILLLLSLVGGGWSVRLLPGDPMTRVALAPAFGIAAIMAFALAWTLVGLPLSRWGGVWPLALAATVGWGVAYLHGTPSPS
jgi:hypothetical protein